MFSFYVFTLLMFRKPNKTTINKNKTNVYLYMVRLICNNVIEMYYLGLSHVAIYSRKVAIGDWCYFPCIICYNGYNVYKYMTALKN